MASRLIQNGWIATVTAGHRAVIFVLGVAIGEAITNENRLKIDVAVLVREDLRGKDRDIMTSIRLTRDMEVLLRILGELLEEEREQSIHILASCNSVADSGAAVGVADINRLVKEDDRRVGVPGVIVIDRLDLLADLARAELCEEASKR